jgi:hypothetical protein
VFRLCVECVCVRSYGGTDDHILKSVPLHFAAAAHVHMLPAHACAATLYQSSLGVFLIDKLVAVWPCNVAEALDIKLCGTLSYTHAYISTSRFM